MRSRNYQKKTRFELLRSHVLRFLLFAAGSVTLMALAATPLFLSLVVINLADLDATGVVQPGSRVSYRELWRGPQASTALQTYRDLIKPGLAANQRLQDSRDGNQQIGGALGKAERYLNMASLVAVLGLGAWLWTPDKPRRELEAKYLSAPGDMVPVAETVTARGTRARRALKEFTIEGVASVLPFHRAVLEEACFNGDAEFGVYTNWIETEFKGVPTNTRIEPVNSGLHRCFIEIDGKRHELGIPLSLFNGAAESASSNTAPASSSEGGVTAPIPGTLQQWLVKDGEPIKKGDGVALIEAMKMETLVVAACDGVITQKVSAGTMVSIGQLLAEIVLPKER